MGSHDFPYTDQSIASGDNVAKVVADISFVDDDFQARTTYGRIAIVERKASVYPMHKYNLLMSI